MRTCLIICLTVAALAVFGSEDARSEPSVQTQGGVGLSPFFARYERSQDVDFNNVTPSSVEATDMNLDGQDFLQIEMRLFGQGTEFFVDRFYVDPVHLNVLKRDFSRSGDRPEFDFSINDGVIEIEYRRGTAALDAATSIKRSGQLSGPVYDPGLAPFVVAARPMNVSESYKLEMLYSGFNLTQPVSRPAVVSITGKNEFEMPDGATVDAFDVEVLFEYPNGRKQKRTYVVSPEPPYQLAADAGSHWRVTAFE